MSTCPVCKSNLTQADLDLGRCPSCQHLLMPETVTPGGQPGHGTMEFSSPEEQEAAQTVLPGESAPAAAAETTLRGEISGDATRPDVAPGTSPSEREKGTADEDLIEKTFLAAGPLVPPVGPPVPPVATAGPPEGEKGTAGDDLIAKTFQAAGPFSPGAPPEPPIAAGPPEREKGTAGEGVIEKTLQGIGPLAPPVPPGPPVPPVVTAPQPEREKGTAGEKQIAATLAPGGLPASADPNSPSKADSAHFALTVESGNIPPEVAERVSSLWSGKVAASATPRSSIKSDGRSVEEESHLVIQPRVLCDAKVAATMRADYEEIKVLGEGGMGVVMAARQASIDRTVALKKIKPAEAGKAESRQKFLAEAIVTGDLEHPNIVPIYDLGKDESGTLFYSMKHVKGTPWDQVIEAKSMQENLEVWMKIADAVAFAHSRGVVHRDLKPENVMLGGFGEVLVMDWGLALTLGAPGAKKAGMGGTPAYMAPEMAIGPMDRIGFPSDIYLLGAILYEIVTGKTPHTGPTVTACLMAVAGNVIQPAEKTGELVDIALKAMATDPQERYSTVSDLQEALRQYQAHAQSVLLSNRAEEDLAKARASEDYEYFARSQFGFQEAFALWNGNDRAKAGIGEATLAYAGQALKNGDYDLGGKLLDPQEPAHALLLKEIRAGQRERDARVQRLKTARRIGVALLLFIIAGGSVAFFWITAERQIAVANAKEAENQRGIAVVKAQEALEQKGKAEANAKEAKENADKAKVQEQIARANAKEAKENADKAKEQETIALANAAEAKKQQGIAETNEKKAVEEKTEADRQRDLADAATKKEAYRGYIARIGLAAAKIEENAFDRAQTLLNECPDKLRDWEWGRLMYLCTQGSRTVDAGDPIEALAFTRDGRHFASGGWGGTVRVWETSSGKKLQEIPAGGDYVFALAFSPDGRNLAIGSNAKPNYIQVWDWHNRQVVKSLPGHRNAVLSLVYSRDGKQLLSGSYDNTARLWDVAAGTSRLFGGHEWWVCSAAFSPDERRVVTACQDGSVMIWDIPSGAGNPVPALTFLGHTGPVYAAVFSPDGQWVASAGYDKRVLVWRPTADEEGTAGEVKVKTKDFASLDGHTAGVRALQFAADGVLLISAGQDNTVRLWDFANRKLRGTLRGHSGRVEAVAMVPPPGATPEQSRPQAAHVDSQLISGGHDGQVKIWKLQEYREAMVLGADILPGHNEAVLGASFSHDGHKILSASRDRTARLWDRTSGSMIRELQQGHQYLVTTAIFFPEGDRFLSAAVDNSTRIWDIATGGQLKVLEHTGLSAAAAISPDGTRIATGGDNKTAKLWNAETGKLVGETPSHQADVTAVAFSPDGTRLFTGDELGHCRLWDIAGQRWVWEVQKHSRGVTAACFRPNGRILTASSDRTVAEWDAVDGTELAALGHPGAVTSMALAGNGRQLLTTCSDGKVRLWDVDKPAEPAAELPTPADETINSVAFSRDDSLAVTTGIKTSQAESSVRLWDIKNLRQMHGGTPLRTFHEVNSLAWASIFSRDGASLLTVIGNEARLINLKSGQESMAFIPQGAIASARFSRDGLRAVTGSWDNTARIWNIETGLVERRLVGHKGYVNDAVFSPDGKLVATAGRDGQTILWDAVTGGTLCCLAGNEGRRLPVTSVAFDPKGERLVTASQDKTAKIWDVQSHRLLVTLAAADATIPAQAGLGAAAAAIRGHTASVLCAAFSPDGTHMLTAGEDNRAIIWNVADGKPLLELLGHTAAVTSVSFSSDGLRAVTGSRDGTAKLWELQEEKGKQEGNELLTLKGHSQEVTTVAFSDDGQHLLTGSLDGTIILWPASNWGAKLAQPEPLGQRNSPLATR